MFPASLLVALHRWYERQIFWAAVQLLYVVSQVDSVVSAGMDTFEPMHVALKRTQNSAGLLNAGPAAGWLGHVAFTLSAVGSVPPSAPPSVVPPSVVPPSVVPPSVVPPSPASLEVPELAVPLDAVPLLAVPLDAVPLLAVPLLAVPLLAVPLLAVPLLAVPLLAVPLLLEPELAPEPASDVDVVSLLHPSHVLA